MYCSISPVSFYGSPRLVEFIVTSSNLISLDHSACVPSPAPRIVVMAESLDLAEQPATTSQLVVNAKKQFENSLDVSALADDLERVAELLRGAVNVAGDCDELANIRTSVLELFNSTRHTLGTARDTARDVLQAQRDVVARFSAGDNDTAVEFLRSNDARARNLSTNATDLGKRIATIANEVGETVEKLLNDRDESATAAKRGEDAVEALQRRRAEAWHNHSTILQSLSECGKLYREQAAAERAAQRRATVAGLFSFVHVADRLLGDRCGFPVLAPVSTYLRSVENDAREKSDTTGALLEAKRRQRELSREVLNELSDASRAVRAVNEDAKIDESRAGQLHKAAGVLRKLKAALLKVEAFMVAVSEVFGAVLSSGYVELVVAISGGGKSFGGSCDVIDASANQEWNPVAPVKRRHVQYYSKWVALEEVCSKCVDVVIEAGTVTGTMEIVAHESTKRKANAANEFRRHALGRLLNANETDEVRDIRENEISRDTEIIDLTDDSKDGETIGREAAVKAALRTVTKY